MSRGRRALAWVGFWGSVLSSLGASAAAPVASPSPKALEAWARKMRELEKTVGDLLVDVSSDTRFYDRANFSRIEKNASQLSKLAADLKAAGTQAGSPGADPSLQIVSAQFADEAAHAYKSLKFGNRAYARNVLKSMTGYCMACHTRNSSGPAFQGSPAEAPVSLRAIEKANYYAATRQFDRALQEYDKMISSPVFAQHNSFDWERAIRSSLAIAVRVKKDPDRALAIVERALAAPKAPFFIKEQASQWKDTILAWKSEPASKAMTESGLHAQALKLVAEARALQKYPADRSADILYLRASAAAHDLLELSPSGELAADALFFAGLCYEVMSDLHLWDMHEFYYLACIYRAPHTEKSRVCYRHYEESVYLGYTGSAGTDVPEDVQAKLNRLEALSRPSARP